MLHWACLLRAKANNHGGKFPEIPFFLLENADLLEQSVGLIWISVAGAFDLRPGGYMGDRHPPRDLAAGVLGLSS